MLSAERAALVTANLDLARIRARMMVRRLKWRVNADDLEQEARLGLMQAAAAWDGRGKFTGWAVTRIDGAMLDWLRHWAQTRSGHVRPAPLMVSYDSGVNNCDTSPAMRLSDDGESARRMLMVADAALVLQCASRALLPRELELLRLRYVEGLLLKDAGKRMGVTESRACQMEGEALQALRAALKK